MKKYLSLVVLAVSFSVEAAPSGAISAIASRLKSDFKLDYSENYSENETEIFVFQPRKNDEKPVFVSYQKKDMAVCLSEKPTFGDLPIREGRLQGMFTIPTIYDPLSRLQDYLAFIDGKGGCWQISWGNNGSRFEDLKQLANSVIQSV